MSSLISHLFSVKGGILNVPATKVIYVCVLQIRFLWLRIDVLGCPMYLISNVVHGYLGMHS